MLTTSLAIGTRALRLLQIIAPNQTAEAEDAQTAFECLNELVDELRTQQAVAPSVLRRAYPLVALQQQYTIGVGGNFNQAWPEVINGVSVIPDRTATNVQEIPIGRPLTEAEFQSITQKSQRAPYPTVIFYDRAWTLGLGVIWVYPVPTTNICDLVLYTPNILGTFATKTTQYDLKPGYVKMLVYNLAADLADEYEKTASPKVMATAARTLANIKRANQEFSLGKVDPAMPGMGRNSQFNPWTGSY